MVTDLQPPAPRAHQAPSLASQARARVRRVLGGWCLTLGRRCARLRLWGKQHPWASTTMQHKAATSPVPQATRVRVVQVSLLFVVQGIIVKQEQLLHNCVRLGMPVQHHQA